MRPQPVRLVGGAIPAVVVAPPVLPGYPESVVAALSDVRVRRVYESDDGYRVLVDRLWPRGVSQGPPRRVVQGRRALNRAAKVVRPRSGSIRRVRTPLSG